MKRCTVLATAALSLAICFGLCVYDPLTPLTQDDMLVIVGFSAVLVTAVSLLCRRLFSSRSAK